MNSTFGDPGFARTGAGHAGDDSPMVRPMRPGNVVPGLYSLSSALAASERPVVARAEAATSELPLNRRSRRLMLWLFFNSDCGVLTFEPSLLMALPFECCGCLRATYSTADFTANSAFNIVLMSF